MPPPAGLRRAECAGDGPAASAITGRRLRGVVVPDGMGDADRGREMAAKVIGKHNVGDALEAVAGLTGDQVPRVRAAASRALITLSAFGA